MPDIAFEFLMSGHIPAEPIGGGGEGGMDDDYGDEGDDGAGAGGGGLGQYNLDP